MSDDMTCTHTYAREADGRCPACGAPPPSPAPARADVVAELRRLYEAATGGRWTWRERDWGATVYDSVGAVANLSDQESDQCQRDAAFIALAHNAMPAILDAIETLRFYAGQDIDRESGALIQTCGWRDDSGRRARTALARLRAGKVRP